MGMTLLLVGDDMDNVANNVDSLLVEVHTTYSYSGD